VCTDGATFRRYDRVIRPASSPQDDDEAAYRTLSRSSANGGGARQAPSRTRSARSRATVRGGTRLRRLGKRGRKQRQEKTAPFRNTRISAPSSLLLFGWLVGWLVGWVGAEISSSDAQSRPAAPSQQPSCQAAAAQGRAATSRSTCTAGGAFRCGRARRRWLGLTVRPRGMARLGSKPGPVAPEGRRGIAHPRRRGG
jgi:hypothetical protein